MKSSTSCGLAPPPPPACKNSHKKMASMCSSLYIMCLSPLSEVSGFATTKMKNYIFIRLKLTSSISNDSADSNGSLSRQLHYCVSNVQISLKCTDSASNVQIGLKCRDWPQMYRIGLKCTVPQMYCA